MTAEDLRALCQANDLALAKAARMIGVGERTFRRWCGKGGRPPRMAGLALRQAIADQQIGMPARKK